MTEKIFTDRHVPNFRILTQVVAEKSLTEKKFTDGQTDRQTDRQTNIITEKAKTIYPLYTSYRGYKHMFRLRNNKKNLVRLLTKGLSNGKEIVTIGTEMGPKSK